MTREEAQKYLDKVADDLSEFFGSVQIMVSTQVGCATRCIKSGRGDWYARQGMAHEFINEDQAQVTAIAIARENSPPEGGDGWKE